MVHLHPVDRAREILGVTLHGLGQLLGVTKAAVHQWRLPGRSVPIAHCYAIERMTGGKVKRWDLRPSDWWVIWPDLVDVPGCPLPKFDQILTGSNFDA